MHRRGNKSHKVPNVKLRPAQPSSSSTSAGSSSRLRVQHDSWAQDSDELNQADTQSGADLCPRPFRGVVVCATGVVDKPTLFKQAVELGAHCIPAFTDRVTHLVASDHGGAKYACAIEHKIPIMKPSWIYESYEIWLRGDDVDLSESLEIHRLPVFTNIILSLSGISDMTRRTQINKLVTHQGGTYMKNLERPVKVTHLLCSGDEETEKMRYAEKFNKKGEANIFLVWEEWFWDSLEFGGRFEEAKYAVTRPRPERKTIPEAPPQPAPQLEPRPLPHPLSKSDIPDPPAYPSADQEEEEEEEIAAIKRAPAVRLQLWESLLKPRGYEITGGKLVRSPTKSQSQAQAGDVDMSPLRSKNKGVEGEGGMNESVISSFRRVNSFAPPKDKDATTSAPRQPFKRIASTGRSRSTSTAPIDKDEGPSMKLFTRLKFRALGEAQSANVRSEIEGCGGRMLNEEDDDEEVDYVIVRLVSGSKLYRDETDELEKSKYRTECWLERCMFEERICPPEEHVSFVPLGIEMPIPGAEDINLSFSGLDQSEACWIRRLLRALGITLAPNFSRRSTHLLCPSGTGAKYDKALEWSVPVVTMEWLEDMARRGVVGAEAGSSFANGNGQSDDCALEMDVDVDVEQDINGTTDLKRRRKEKDDSVTLGKGKEREIDIDPKMADITNNDDYASDRPMPKPSAPLGRTETILRASPEEDMSMFGRPNGSLGQPSKRRRLSIATPPPSSSRQSSIGPTRQPTLAEIEIDMQQTRIPSSTSPSPMKLPQSREGSKSSIVPGGSSPIKVSNEVTKALQESITSLLGKRPSVEEDASLNTGQQPGKPGKRARPQAKSKPRSRPESGYTNAPDIVGMGPPDSPYRRSPSPLENDELNLVGEGQSFEESMRVMYEDPGQLEEKEKLMKLLESQTQGEGHGSAGKRVTKKGVPGVRRSTRMAAY